jgi:hypothetical protein
MLILPQWHKKSTTKRERERERALSIKTNCFILNKYKQNKSSIIIIRGIYKELNPSCRVYYHTKTRKTKQNKTRRKKNEDDIVYRGCGYIYMLDSYFKQQIEVCLYLLFSISTKHRIQLKWIYTRIRTKPPRTKKKAKYVQRLKTWKSFVGKIKRNVTCKMFISRIL